MTLCSYKNCYKSHVSSLHHVYVSLIKYQTLKRRYWLKRLFTKRESHGVELGYAGFFFVEYAVKLIAIISHLSHCELAEQIKGKVFINVFSYLIELRNNFSLIVSSKNQINLYNFIQASSLLYRKSCTRQRENPESPYSSIRRPSNHLPCHYNNAG